MMTTEDELRVLLVLLALAIALWLAAWLIDDPALSREAPETTLGTMEGSSFTA